jgi:hypothetical protein
MSSIDPAITHRLFFMRLPWVEGLSDSLTDDPGNKQPWQTRKESYIERLRDPLPRAVYGTDTLFTLAENSR